jgi:hypothetical protein
VGCVGVWGVWGSRPLLTFDIPQTALVATLDTYDFRNGYLFLERFILLSCYLQFCWHQFQNTALKMVFGISSIVVKAFSNEMAPNP